MVVMVAGHGAVEMGMLLHCLLQLQTLLPLLHLRHGDGTSEHTPVLLPQHMRTMKAAPLTRVDALRFQVGSRRVRNVLAHAASQHESQIYLLTE